MQYSVLCLVHFQPFLSTMSCSSCTCSHASKAPDQTVRAAEQSTSNPSSPSLNREPSLASKRGHAIPSLTTPATLPSSTQPSNTDSEGGTLIDASRDVECWQKENGVH